MDLSTITRSPFDENAAISMIKKLDQKLLFLILIFDINSNLKFMITFITEYSIFKLFKVIKLIVIQKFYLIL